MAHIWYGLISTQRTDIFSINLWIAFFGFLVGIHLVTETRVDNINYLTCLFILWLNVLILSLMGSDRFNEMNLNAGMTHNICHAKISLKHSWLSLNQSVLSKLSYFLFVQSKISLINLYNKISYKKFLTWRLSTLDTSFHVTFDMFIISFDSNNS